MKNKIILNGAMMTCLVFVSAPAFADNDEYVINETYENSCNSGVLGAFSGTVSAIANFETCPSGEYADNNSCVSCPTGFGTTDSGAGVADECYTSCVASDVAHAATVTGRNYYGNGRDTCAPVTCISGYTKQTVGPRLPSGNGNSYTPTGSGASAANWTVTWTSSNVQGTATGIWACKDTSAGSPYTASANLNATGGEQTGGNCWCKMTNWTPSGESAQDAESSWVFYNGYGSASGCARDCALYCGYGVQSRSDMRSALFGSVAEKDVCVANTITINWQNATGGTHASNTCVYDGTLTTPTTAPTKTGYVFVGWTFETNNQ